MANPFNTDWTKDPVKEVVVAEEPPAPKAPDIKPATLSDGIAANLAGNSSEVIISFDTTGSMYPCLAAVRKDVGETCNNLFDTLPGLKIGIISHGDYCDGQLRIDSLRLTTDRDRVKDFIIRTPATAGGDSPECYELSLHTARGLGWTEGKNKMLVLIGDDEPHPPEYPGNELHLDWRVELAALKELGVKVFPVQCMYCQTRNRVNAFWEEVAHLAGTQLFKFYEGEDFEKTSTSIFTGMVAASAGSEAYERYSSTTIGMANNAKLSDRTLSGLTETASLYDPDEEKKG